MYCAAVIKALSAVFDDADCRAFMGMFCEGILKVTGLEKFDITENIDAPNFRKFDLMKRIVVVLHAGVRETSQYVPNMKASIGQSS